MSIGKVIKDLVVAAAFSAAASSYALAQDSTLKFGLCFDLSKSYTFVSPQVAQAAQDLATLTNMKGGIDGHKIEIVVQDHGNEPQRGIECYEKLKREGVFVFDMLSTPVSIAVLPRIMKDKNILMQSSVGRGDAVDGSVFTQIFPVGATYWGQAANDIAYIKQQRGGDLKGAKIGFIYLDYPFGQEPIGVLKTLAEREGFELKLYPVPLPGSDQTSAWTQVRRDRPDFMISWLLAGGHVVAAKEMKRNGYPIEKYISVNWLNEVDIANIGPDVAKGVKRGTNVVGGQDVPVIKEIMAELYAKGKGSGPEKNLKDVYYNLGLANYSVAFEAARNAVKQAGWPVTAASMKAGYESLKNFDANGLLAPVTVTAQDHGGGGKTRIEMWDGQKWVPQTGWLADYQDLIWQIVKTSSSGFKVE
ncbi:ABC transporter substrate-binding protein [Bradyrhizobium sp. INPA01-394B]|uniref:ABC transporter substrate-binding protein n=1 Tax=Bradyrhizobium campsiandrae TaxID=1729892 RepID=A0ABR7U582_9BRAD|nr:ABC transporter substrate-binding protein [Bradyrhizobium campsiandrae]MBC9880057.1 ABC transporter substrate-binding protein [Bradyrhizobium campsiandrae]MBC9978978.1 ABC transporter substrate-binding protein [Bradyrhizobium campsiandrae]